MATVPGQSDLDDPFADCSIASLLPRTLGGYISAGAMSESDDQDIVGNLLLKSTKLKNYTQLVENAKLIRKLVGNAKTCDSQVGPVIDYSCLENITDPTEYFSTHRMLENANKEVRRLKGESSPRRQPQVRRDHQRRPGLPGLEGKKYVFKFSDKFASVEASQMENSTLSNGLNTTDLINSSCSKEISQTEKSHTAEPERKLAGNSKTCDSQVGPVIDYSCLENITDPTEYFSTYRMLENAEKEVRRLKGEVSPRRQPQVRRDRQRRPGLPGLEGKKYVFKFPDKFASVEASQMESSTLSNVLNTTDLINSSCSKEISQTEKSYTVEPERKLAGNAKTCDVDEGFDELESLYSKCRDLEDDESGIENILRETLQINPIHVEKLRGFPSFVETESTYESIYSSVTNGNKIDGFSDLKDRSTVINRQGNPFFSPNCDGETKSDGSKELSSSGKDFCDVGTKKLTGNDREKQNDELENPKFDFKDFRVDEITKLEQETLKTTLLDAKENNDIFDGKTSEPKGHQISLLEMEICPRSDGLICDKELASDVNFLEVSTRAPEHQLQPEVCQENPNVVNEQVEVPCKVLNGSAKNQRHSEASGGSRCKKLKRKEQILKRKSLAGTGTVWESGVRRSTRIRMKPLQFWCGERVLYGRVHDSLATVIGVKKFGTPPAGKKAEMKVKSFVTEQYADLVAKAALH